MKNIADKRSRNISETGFKGQFLFSHVKLTNCFNAFSLQPSQS